MATKTRTKAAESKTRKRKADNPDQYERFREAVREHETNRAEDAFEHVFRKIVPPQSS
jgi:hypothetical protein